MKQILTVSLGSFAFFAECFANFAVLGFCVFEMDREIKVFNRKVRKAFRKERKDFFNWDTIHVLECVADHRQ